MKDTIDKTDELGEIKELLNSLRDDAPVYPFWTIGQIKALLNNAHILGGIEERKLLTWKQLENKLIKADAHSVEFEVIMKTSCNVPHYCVFASDDNAWGVAIDGQNVINHVKRQLKQNIKETKL